MTASRASTDRWKGEVARACRLLACFCQGKRAGLQQGDPLLMLPQHPVPHPVCGTQNMSGVGISRRSGTSGLGYQDVMPGLIYQEIGK
ncbi:hypothetical protein [Aeromonas veronii]|uniref:hypothetical protein n=1 Tax=Aeromonas veronii TaxID=654 RepID=UPI001115E6DC|nr:hypothetical protein [Aeromonas veronii]